MVKWFNETTESVEELLAVHEYLVTVDDENEGL